MSIIFKIALSLAILLNNGASFIVKHLPQQFGAFTTLNSTDRQTDFPTTYNNNLTKTIEVGTTSVASITALPNQITTGTLTTGTWNANTITVPYGGTGSTTLSQFQILLGSSTNPVAVVNGLGTSGQTLQSQGAGQPPQWAANQTDQTANYTWTGTHTFNNTATLNGETKTASTTARGVLIGGDIRATSTLTVATGTPALTTGISSAAPAYFANAVGIGIATSSVNTNLEIRGNLIIFGNATTSGISNHIIQSTTRTSSDASCSGSVNNPCTKTTTCNAGEIAISGGAETSDTSNAFLAASKPSGSTGWTGISATRANVSTYTLTTYAICIPF